MSGLLSREDAQVAVADTMWSLLMVGSSAVVAGEPMICRMPAILGAISAYWLTAFCTS